MIDFAVAPQPSSAPSWLVCHGELRAIADGRVTCPIVGVTAATDCLACRWLEARDGERSGAFDCLVPVRPNR